MPNTTPIPSFVERLERTRTESLATIDSVLARAGDEDRDLTETEEQTLSDARQRLERADEQRTEWVELLERRASGDELANRVSGALARSGVAEQHAQPGRLVVTDPDDELRRLFRSPGEYIATYVASRAGDSAATERLNRIADQTVADNLGIVPTPIVGPVLNMIANVRPTVASANNRPMPMNSGRSFTRPLITQHTDVGAQATEKTELNSRKMLISPITVNKQTYGGTLDISFQDRDWTDPGILQIVIDDLATVYARQTNAGFATAFAGVAMPPVAILTPDGKGVTAAIASAAAAIYAATSRFPDTIWAAPSEWAKLASMVDTTGRPLFPVIGPMNASGQVDAATFNGNVYGLRLVVDASLPAATLIVGVSSLAEFYEQIGGQLSVTEPSILGFIVAYYGYVGWCFPVAGAFNLLTGL